MACDAMNRNKKIGTASPPQFWKKAIETKLNEMIYPMEPIYINVFLPKRSIKKTPSKVNITFVTPIPILLNKAVLSPRPASSNIRGSNIKKH